MRVFLAGEGKHELGNWYDHPSHRSDPPTPGILEALLRKVKPEGWEIVGATVWKSIRKFKAGERMPAETRNVLGAVLDARDHRCDFLAFSRDRDGKTERAAAIERGIEEASRAYPAPRVIGAVAIEQIESWVLSVAGHLRAESHTDAKAAAEAVFGDASLETLLTEIEGGDIANLPADAFSLKAWLARADAALPK